MDNTFLTAFIAPKEWEICGYKLKPYSLRIHFNLVAVESPFVTGRIPTPSDTVQFLRYCSEGNRNILDTGTERFKDGLFYYKLAFDVKKHVEVIKKITLYIKEYTNVPSFRIKSKIDEVNKFAREQESVVKERTVPEMMTMMCLCMQKVNLSEEEVMTMPLGKVAWYAATIAIIEGGDVQIEETLDKEDAELVKKAMDEHAHEFAKKLREDMANGKIPKRKVRVE